MYTIVKMSRIQFATILIGILLLPVRVTLADEYGGWFGAYSFKDCFIIDNLAGLDYQVQIDTPSATSEKLTTTIAKPGQCYDSSSYVLPLNGAKDYINLENFTGINSSYFLTYFDLGLPPDLFTYDTKLDAAKGAGFRRDLTALLARIDEDFARCDTRTQVRNHMTIEPNATFKKATEEWVQNGRTVSPSASLAGLNGREKSAAIAQAIGCQPTYEAYAGGQTQQLVTQYLSPYLPEGYISQNVGVDQTSGKPPSNTFSWWWILIGAIVLATAYAILRFYRFSRKIS